MTTSRTRKLQRLRHCKSARIFITVVRNASRFWSQSLERHETVNNLCNFVTSKWHARNIRGGMLLVRVSQPKDDIMHDFLQELQTQRWDDHRYYHHSRINQSLHFVSAAGFLVAYAMLFTSPAMAAVIGWLVSMVTRQSGHFFFEPLGYDEVNRATHEYKEAVKVGYNLKRKIVLMTIWILAPFALLADPSLFGIFRPAENVSQQIEHVGLTWLAVGAGGLLFRTVHLFFLRDVQTGLVWMTKILTDPFNDLLLYYRSPLKLLQGELIDPMHELREREQGA